MSASKQRFSSHALNAAQQLGKGVFRQAAATAAAPVPVAPDTLPKTDFPYVDNLLVMDLGSHTRAVIQRHGLSFTFRHTPAGKNEFELKWEIDRKGSYLSRQINGPEVDYILKIMEPLIDPNDMTFMRPALDAWRKDLPKSDYPTERIKISNGDYVVNNAGFQYRVGVAPPYNSRVIYRKPDDGQMSVRDPRPLEYLMLRRAIATTMTVDQAVQKQDMFKALEDLQYK